jgi:hypothetical protein
MYAELMAIKTWQTTADLLFPNEFAVDVVDGAPRLPDRLEPQSRIPTQQRDFAGATVFIRPGDPQRVPAVETDLRWAVAALTVRVESDAEDAGTAADAAVPYLDRVLEALSFQMQFSLQIQGLEGIDLTGPPEVGDEREFFRWSGFATPTFRPTSVPMQSLIGRQIPDLMVDLDPADQRANRALDWYLKALTAQFEADHFIFLWIAAEILAADSDLKVSEPYRGPACGHVISHCPQCDAETTKPVQGASIKRFFTEGFGVDENIAKRLWRARQMLHGAYDFDSKVMSELAGLSQHLRAVVVAALKPRIGIPDHEPPFAASTGLSIAPFMGVGGTRKVTQRDLTPLDDQPSIFDVS